MAASASSLHRLNIFEGTWRTHGTIVADGGAPATEFSGTDTYAWLPGGAFMLHQVDVMMGADHNQTTEVMGYDPATGRYTLHYFDNQGGHGLMYGDWQGDTWTITSDTLRFYGSFDKSGTALTGTWQKYHNGKAWLSFLTLSLVKI